MAVSGSDRHPLVSVVIPTYGRPRLLTNAVESVTEQSYENVEMLIVDDGSDARVEEGLEDLSIPSTMDLRVYHHERNRGANVARNTGIEASRGEFVAFLDDDDYWRPEKLERQVRAFQAAGDDVGVSFTGQVYVDPSGEVTNVTRPTEHGDFTKQLVQGAHFGTFSTIMVRASVFDRTGYLDEEFPCWQDREWYFRLASHYDFVSVPELLTVRQFIDGPQISDDYEAKRDQAYPLMLQKHRESAAACGPRYERRFQGVLARAVADHAISAGHYFEAIRYLVRSLQYYPTSPTTYAFLAVALGGRYTHTLARAGKRFVNRYQNTTVVGDDGLLSSH
ncbi:glycosyltransferase family 2 protein [Haloarchaeobius sp. HRN-SO-5]|uniref:glycosyltransferase family 2 protein n=1 Tax=Haloarchaeobius sp. HRN-SO-5 TaxID=3446118 RepID=UPI003EBA1CF6